MARICVIYYRRPNHSIVWINSHIAAARKHDHSAKCEKQITEIIGIPAQAASSTLPSERHVLMPRSLRYRSQASTISRSPEFPPRGQIRRASTFVGGSRDCCLSVGIGCFAVVISSAMPNYLGRAKFRFIVLPLRPEYPVFAHKSSRRHSL